jgi:CRP-like cAMP-binding protein
MKPVRELSMAVPRLGALGRRARALESRVGRDDSAGMPLVDDLQSMPVFANATREQLEAVAKFGEEKDVPAGAVLTHEGAYEGTVFVVIVGSVAIERGGKAVNLIRAGDFFGEIEAIDGGPRMATARAIEDTRVAVLSHRQFNDLLDSVPDLREQVMAAMESRLERVDREE